MLMGNELETQMIFISFSQCDHYKYFSCRFNLNCHLKTNSVIYNLSYLMTQIRGADYNKLLKICNNKRVNFDD